MFPVGQLQTRQVRFFAICHDNILLRLDFLTPRFSVNVWSVKHNMASIWRKNMLGYLYADIICSKKRTVFQGRSRKTASCKEQIMFQDKYPGIFAPIGGYCVYYPSNLFRNTCSLQIGEYSRILPSLGWWIFGHVTPWLDQSRASENIWWIILNNYLPK